jgi:hypothetical protein
MKHTEMIMVIEAHSEGNAVQFSAKLANLGWTDMRPATGFNFCEFDYRVKPASKYATLKEVESEEKYVEIKALEDALKLMHGRTLNVDDMRIYDELKSLIS